MEALKSWWQSRVPVSGDDLVTLTNEPVPYHMKRWWFCLGGTPAYLFLIQIVTGIMLAFFYQATPEAAYDSIEHITNEVRFGWYFRSLHKWAATLMIAAVILHQLRVFFTGAYRAPREINWLIGMGLLGCSLMLGFTGYCLVFEQLSYWGAAVGANIAELTPIVGTTIKRMMLGGDAYSAQTLPRFYITHVAILPAALIGLLVIHIVFIRLHGITELQFEDEKLDEESKHFDFFPDHVFTELMVGLVLMVVLSALATIFPAEMGHRANELVTPEIIKPEWFFYPTFRWLKLFSGTVAILSIGFVAFAMVVWPWIDSALRRITKSELPGMLIGIAVVLGIIALTVWEAIVAH